MNITLWILQAVIAITFTYSGICKLTLSIPKMVALGQTGVEIVPLSLVRFIGISEILGSIGLILPGLIGVMPFLVVAAAIGIGVIMVPASAIHVSRKEFKAVLGNTVVLAICLIIACGRSYLLKN